MSINMKLARQLAKKIVSIDWCIVRDEVDIATSGELDCWQLDMLTGWVVEAVKNNGETA
jgi:hypothetical protein|tara:strand:- start:23 stop:199 length:177 start_codon:yes stop_codon:yes gene_type:complete